MIKIVFSIIAGIFTGIGMGGGAVLIFLLTTFSRLEQHIAQGANLIFFIPACIASIIINLRNKNIEIKTAVIVSLSGVIGAIIGSGISTNVSVESLKKYFGLFLAFIAFYEIFILIKHYKIKKK